MNAWLKKIKMSAVLVSFLVFVIALLGANYFRTHLFLKQQVKAYVVQNMPTGLSGEQKAETAKALYFEFMGKPMQKVSALVILFVAFLVSGYAAGTMSDSHINAIVAAMAGALLFLTQIHSMAYGLAILLGMVFCLAGSKIGIYRQQRLKRDKII
jgi:hypothetical protein